MTENKNTYEQTPLAYFKNKKGVEFVAYSPQQVEDAKKAGYEQVRADVKSVEPVIKHKEEKIG